MKTVTILGASGSIGTSAVRYLRLHRDTFDLKFIALRQDWQTALRLTEEFGCKTVCFADPDAADRFRQEIGVSGVRVASGLQAIVEMAAEPVDVVLAAISGSAGLPSVISAVRAGNRVALANKEALVCGGSALLTLAATTGARIIPVDSEHSAIAQAMMAGRRDQLSSILLTASGGPFCTSTLEEMRTATPEMALRHPNWSMGPKITIDSATLANKGLELIEAAHLFDCSESQIQVVINPSSIMHSAVAFRDGSIMAQLGKPDMRVAIGYALSWPDRLATGVEQLDFAGLGRLDFEPVDPIKFRCLEMARQALRISRDGPLLFNAANEVGVAAFQMGTIGLLDISYLIESCLEHGHGRFVGDLDDAADRTAAALQFGEEMLSSLAIDRRAEA